MTPFEWGILAIVALGFVVPAWIVAFGFLARSRRPEAEEPNKRYFAYAALLQSLHAQMDIKTRTVRNGPLFAATVRELANYPEYRTLSVLFLEEITVTGTKKFDNVVRAELKAVEAGLLDAADA
ncbi:MAG: hypothetical protein ABJN35_02240 [Erythrobacter sp.]|uniref:hypothetical protein n=1 Tax=Erythrobacter sp. Alg231-14 TaxID=1922225 RepID=UPI00307B1A48